MGSSHLTRTPAVARRLALALALALFALLSTSVSVCVADGAQPTLTTDAGRVEITAEDLVLRHKDTTISIAAMRSDAAWSLEAIAALVATTDQDRSTAAAASKGLQAALDAQSSGAIYSNSQLQRAIQDNTDADSKTAGNLGTVSTLTARLTSDLSALGSTVGTISANVDLVSTSVTQERSRAIWSENSVGAKCQADLSSLRSSLVVTQTAVSSSQADVSSLRSAMMLSQASTATRLEQEISRSIAFDTLLSRTVSTLALTEDNSINSCSGKRLRCAHFVNKGTGSGIQWSHCYAFSTTLEACFGYWPSQKLVCTEPASSELILNLVTDSTPPQQWTVSMTGWPIRYGLSTDTAHNIDGRQEKLDAIARSMGYLYGDATLMFNGNPNSYTSTFMDDTTCLVQYAGNQAADIITLHFHDNAALRKSRRRRDEPGLLPPPQNTTSTSADLNNAGGASENEQPPYPGATRVGGAWLLQDAALLVSP